MAVANIEVRAPLVGIFRREMTYGRVPIEIAGFFDAGIVWSAANKPTFLGGGRSLVRSDGFAARFNAFGIVIVEAALSHPFDRLRGGWQFQIGLKQGF
jgi:hypothetical protein